MSDQSSCDQISSDCRCPTVFVVGFYRSGTSLLYSLLNQHPDVALMYEAHPWRFPWFLPGGRIEHDWLDRLECYAGTLSRHALSAPMLRRMGVNSPDALYDAFAARSGAAIRGEKSPAYAESLAALVESNPDARIIVIWRDPVDTWDSILRAARSSRFFRRRGMLARLISAGEAMARDTAALTKSGAKLFETTYDDLVDHTEATCRRLCEFLGIPWDPQMASLDHADLSAVFPDRQHAQLRRRAITRSTEPRLVTPAAHRLLTAFNTRWRRLRGLPALPDDGPEPAMWQRAVRRFAGRWFALRDAAVDRCYANVPLPWIKTWRTLREWCTSSPTVAPASLTRSVTAVSVLLVAGTALADSWTGAVLTLAPLYALATALAAFGAARRIGTIIAALAAVSWSIAQGWAHAVAADRDLLLLPLVWNSAMRFLLLAMVATLVSFVRDMHGGGTPSEEPTA